MTNTQQFYALWAINAPLDLGRLCSQLDDLKQSGLDGLHA